MATEVIMPKVDMVMETGTFVEWLKKEGEHVNKGDPLFVIDTDKAAIEMESPADGILAGVKAKLNDVIPVTEVIAYLLAPGEKLPDKNKKVPPPQTVTILAPPRGSDPAVVEMVAALAAEEGPSKVRVTPVARHLAENLGLDLTKIPGRGPRGRIHKADVLAFQESQSAQEQVMLRSDSGTRTLRPSCGCDTHCPGRRDTASGCPQKTGHPPGWRAQDHLGTAGLQRVHRSPHQSFPESGHDRGHPPARTFAGTSEGTNRSEGFLYGHPGTRGCNRAAASPVSQRFASQMAKSSFGRISIWALRPAWKRT